MNGRTACELDEPARRERHPHLNAWAVSAFLHVLSVGATLVLVARIERPAELEPFC
ncbi:MAG: hypothetical protein AB7F94_03780 [Nitrospira sp.]